MLLLRNFMRLPVSLWLASLTCVSISSFVRFFSLTEQLRLLPPSGGLLAETEDHWRLSGLGPPNPKPVNIRSKLASMAPIDYRQCTSPENHVEWPLAGSVQSKTSSLTCGLKSDFGSFLNHNITLPVSISEECQRLAVYGVAFGSTFVKELKKTAKRNALVFDHKKLIKDHGRCFFMFVLEEDLPESMAKGKPTMIGHTWLLPIPRQVLPYQSLRRNVKLLKYNGHFLFKRSQAVIWQDAKFFRPNEARRQPRNYLDLVPTDACVQTMGLPVHPNVFGEENLQEAVAASQTRHRQNYHYHPQYIHHCQTIIESLVKRPNVTDSVNNLMSQCYSYLQHVVSNEDKVSLMNHGLLDSAFLVWNQSSEKCRKFNAELQCTLSDQLQCHSDRDQVSFPFAFYKMGLRALPQRSHAFSIADGRRHDLELVIPSSDSGDDGDEIMVRMTRSSCHWYFARLGECPSQDLPSVAVMVAGGATRFLFNSTIKHLVKPLVNDNYKVDYYASLAIAKSQAYRQDSASYMEHNTMDPIFKRRKKKQTPKEIMWSIRDTIRDQLDDAGSFLAGLKLRETAMEPTQSTRMRQRYKEARRRHRDEDVNLRFPALDMRPSAQQRTAVGNKNMLKLFYGLEDLWDSKLIWHESFMGNQYDYVIILRDDAFWLEDFDMQALLDTNPNADAYVLSCDDRHPPMLTQEMNDHGIVVKRSKAHLFGRYFSTLLSTELSDCHAAAKSVVGPVRGCNSEMILQWIVNSHQVRVQRVPQSVLPFERAVTLKHPTSGRIQTCFHKFCQSKESPLEIDPALMACRDVEIE